MILVTNTGIFSCMHNFLTHQKTEAFSWPVCKKMVILYNLFIPETKLQHICKEKTE